MEGLPSATWIFLVSAHGNLMGRVPFFVAEDMGHRVRVHNLLCPALHHCCPSSRVLTHPICWGPHLAEELPEAGKDWAEGRSGSLFCHAWPRGPPRCRPGPTESEELRTASAFLPARTDRRISEPLEQQDGKGRPLRSEGAGMKGETGKVASFLFVDCYLCFSFPVIFLPLRLNRGAQVPLGRGGRIQSSSCGRVGRVGNGCQAETEHRKPFGAHRRERCVKL